MPKIVFDELEANIKRELQSRLQKWIRAREQLEGLSLELDIPRVELDLEERATAYMKRLLRRLGLDEDDVIPFGEGYLEDVVERAISRKPPCTDRGEEIRDALLWLYVLDISRQRKDHVVFVSRNTKQFSGKGKDLHAALADEAIRAGADIRYLPSLDEFARLHATNIAFITKEWLQNALGEDYVFDSARDVILNSAASIAKARLGLDEEVVDGYSIESGYVEVDEFYVYEMSSGEYRVESTWKGSADVEYEVENEKWRSWADEVEFGHVYMDPPYHERRRKRKTLELDVTIHVEALVENEVVVSFETINARADQ